MNIWGSSIDKALNDNHHNTVFYENYKKSHVELLDNLKFYNEHLSPSIMVPVCNRVLMKGNLIHTNEIMVSLGSGYFVKSSSKDAQDICHRRLIKAEAMLRDLEKEREFLTNQIDFTNENILPTDCNEIIEPYDEETEKKWKEQHRQKISLHKKQEKKQRDEIDDEDFMNKLELLELQEEINSISVSQTSSNENKVYDDESESKELSLRKKLAQLRQREKTKCNTEEDILKRLDELEEEEELEDELDRFYENNSIKPEKESDSSSDSDDSIIEHISNDETYVDDAKNCTTDVKSKNPGTSNKRKVSFADVISSSNETETININFTHTDTVVSEKPYTGTLESPSDIYNKFPNYLKKTKPIIKNCHKVSEETHSNTEIEQQPEIKYVPFNNQTVLGDIIEHKNEFDSQKKEVNERQISKFKSMRLKNKQSHLN